MTMDPYKTTGRAQIYAQMGPLRDLLARPGVFECCINRPGVTWVETAGGWTDHATPELTFERLRGLALALASWNVTASVQRNRSCRPWPQMVSACSLCCRLQSKPV